MVLIAPFIKRSVMEECIDAVPEGVPITVYTRWDPSEVANGVSDPGIITLGPIEDSVWLVPSLHAKAYIVDDRALVGSANLTQRALGLEKGVGNVEVLVPIAASAPEIAALMEDIGLTARRTNANYAAAVTEQARLSAIVDVPEGNVAIPRFYPTCRNPSRVTALCLGDAPTHPGDADAEADILRLGIPRGLDESGVRDIIATHLRAHPDLSPLYHAGIINSATLINSVVTNVGVEGAEADRRVDTLVRWLQHFCGDVRTQQASFDIVLGKEFG